MSDKRDRHRERSDRRYPSLEILLVNVLGLLSAGTAIWSLRQTPADFVKLLLTFAVVVVVGVLIRVFATLMELRYFSRGKKSLTDSSAISGLDLLLAQHREDLAAALAEFSGGTGS